MRAIIIEDEPLSVAELRTTLAEVAPQIEVVATASSVAEAAAVIAGVGHDLIFMDIHLGDGSGFDIFQRTEISVPVIFITAYDSYALKAFENKGIDYLLKPFGREDLQRAIDKLGLLSGGGSASAEHGAPTQTPPVYQERFLVHMGARMKSVTTAEIAYFMADGKYLHLHRRPHADRSGRKTAAEPLFSDQPPFHRRLRRHPGDDTLLGQPNQGGAPPAPRRRRGGVRQHRPRARFQAVAEPVALQTISHKTLRERIFRIIPAIFDFKRVSFAHREKRSGWVVLEVHSIRPVRGMCGNSRL